MSRANVAKSRADKGPKPTAPTPAVTHEIVPGKFNNNDWTSMVDHDDSDDFIFDIVGEICNNSIDIIYKNYIERQLIPFTVSQAKDALLQIIEWQFLSRDTGELTLDGALVDTEDIVIQDVDEWAEDEEPCTSKPDCWAQGSVPRQYVNPPTPSIAEVDEEQPEDEIKAEAEETTAEEQFIPEEGLQEGSLPAEESTLGDEGVGSTEESTLVEEEEEETEEQEEQPQPAQTEVKDKPTGLKSKRKYKPKRGKLGSAGVSRMTESLDSAEMKRHLPTQDKPTEIHKLLMPLSCQSLLRLQGGRPPGSREVEYDDKGNVINMVKIDPDALPTHYVRTKYTVVDPAVEAAQAHLQAMRTGKYVGAARKKAMMTSPRLPRSSSKLVSATGKTSTLATTQDKGSISPLPAPLMESMDLVPGVVVREGGRIKVGPRFVTKRDASAIKTSTKTLRPVNIKGTMPAIAVAELLDRNTPIIKPLQEEMPIPPILPHPPSQPIGSR